jgi:hypothetical protein
MLKEEQRTVVGKRGGMNIEYLLPPSRRQQKNVELSSLLKLCVFMVLYDLRSWGWVQASSLRLSLLRHHHLGKTVSRGQRRAQEVNRRQTSHSGSMSGSVRAQLCDATYGESLVVADADNDVNDAALHLS